MTLGSNAKNVWNYFNEPKKRKHEVMNGLAEDTSDPKPNHSTQHSLRKADSTSDEIPAKRSRIDFNPNMSSDVFQRNNQKKGFIGSIRDAWDRFMGKQRDSDTVSTVSSTQDNSRSCNSLVATTSGIGSGERQWTDIPLRATSEPLPSQTEANQHFNPNIRIGFSIPDRNPTERVVNKKKKRFSYLMDKNNYKKLLERHLTSRLTANKQPVAKAVEIVDLASDETEPSNSTQFRTEVINKNTNMCSNLLNRIKKGGFNVGVEPSTSKSRLWSIGSKGTSIATQSWSKPLSLSYNLNEKTTEKNNRLISPVIPLEHSTPKHTSVDINKQTPPRVVSTPPRSPTSPLPESSVRFREKSEKQKDYFNESFISDMKTSLSQNSLKLERKISLKEQIVSELKTKRTTDCEILSQKIRQPVTLKDKYSIGSVVVYIPIDEKRDVSDDEFFSEEEEEPAFPELSPEINKQIENALRPTPPNEVLSEGPTGQICRKDMETLKGLNWLNDEIINFYLSLIVERGKNDNFSTVYAFNTFFYKKLRDSGPQSLKRWTRRVDVFANDYIFIPIHLGMHWCLAVIDFVDKKIEYYDSMGGTNFECVQALKDWLQSESIDKKKVEFPMTEWDLLMAKEIPQQMNGSDCGMFTCKYAEYISRRAKINFSQAHMPYFRRRMVYEILTKQLL